jgi:hypothetical protein
MALAGRGLLVDLRRILEQVLRRGLRSRRQLIGA